MSSLTYRRLFNHLEQLGFEDVSPSTFERAFQHPTREILLAFSMLDDASEDRPVRAADLLSVETRLQHQGLLSGRLADAAQPFRR